MLKGRSPRITAAAAAADELVLGTFNCEFLLPAKVHLKYGFPFELEPQDAESWGRPGYRQEQYEKLTDAVYERRGWTRDGVPTLETLTALGIDFPDVVRVIARTL